MNIYTGLSGGRSDTDPKKFLRNPRVFQKLQKRDRGGGGKMEMEVEIEAEEEQRAEEGEDRGRLRRTEERGSRTPWVPPGGTQVEGRREQTSDPDVGVRNADVRARDEGGRARGESTREN